MLVFHSKYTQQSCFNRIISITENNELVGIYFYANEFQKLTSQDTII